ncbi:MAG: N-6 DNA methylase [Coriobacteriia bacterium]|nr:N-6 DNA methylase [Coriobacteriia bacterium]
MGGAVAEISYYPAIRQLLDEVGRHLKPKVRAIMQLRNAGAGNPDGGLFTQNQWKLVEGSPDPLSGQIPARGAIEVKGTAEEISNIAASEQVARYVERYGIVLVTNLRDFVLVGKDAGGVVCELESCRLSANEASFWGRAQQPRTFAEQAGEGLTEFLRRVLLHSAPLSDPKDLAWFLASYARTARLRLEHRHELPALDQLRSQLEESLGLKFEGEKGDHFFRSTLVQTLFYGMFAAWVLWARDRDHSKKIDWSDRFQWETATATLHVPMVYELFRQFADIRQLGALGIAEVLEWAEEILWRVDRAAFFARFKEDHAVQYFYEPFLEAFDPQLRKEMGVWYTPDEVVKYMVARVDWALREELGIADGLADESVVVLDPCCGTGAFLVEVLRKIDETLTAKGADALTRQDVKRAAMHRVIGFEIMPAPYVIAHLQMGILLAELGVPLRDADQRAAIYLTNALTGWGDGQAAPPKDKRVGEGQMHSTLLFPEFAEERDAANRIKREEQILVVIGNPPYNIYAGMAVDEERELSDSYRTTKRVAKPQGRGLNDLFVRFFRLAERQIAERNARGLVCLISNNAWLDALSYTGMRERYLEQFDSIWIDNLNGDKYKTGKVTPDGAPDPSIFSTPKNREGIQVGTAIALLARKGVLHDGQPLVQYRDLWGSDKLHKLDDAVGTTGPEYLTLEPSVDLGLTLLPQFANAEYFTWPRLPELMPTFYSGVITARDEALVDIDRARLESRMRLYFSDVSEAEVARVAPSLLVKNETYDPPVVRRVLQQRGFRSDCVLPYAYRPFDIRWLYWEDETALVIRPRREYKAEFDASKLWLVAAQRYRKCYSPPMVGYNAFAFHVIESGANVFPTSVAGQGTLIESVQPLENVSGHTAVWLTAIRREAQAELVMHYVLGITHSSQYARENAHALVQDWSRIPLVAGADVFDRVVATGAVVDRLLDVSAPFSSQLRFGTLTGTNVVLDPSTDLAITARWGHAGQGGITMPSTGKLIERDYCTDERAVIDEAAESLGMSGEQTIALLGETCFDVYLNDVAYWRCVPASVWRYTIGGYQVIKKWLSYRERALLGRDLKPEEARYVTEMVRRIAALVLMRPELDANYERVKSDVWEWGRGKSDS